LCYFNFYSGSNETEHQHHVEERSQDRKMSQQFSVYAGLTLGQLCANWMMGGGGKPNPPTSPRPPVTRPTPRSKQIFSTKKPAVIIENNDDDDDGADHCNLNPDESTDYDDYSEDTDQEQNLRDRYSNQPTQKLPPTRPPTTPLPIAGPSNDRQRPNKRPSIDGPQDGEPQVKRPRPQNEAHQNRILPEANPADGIVYPIDPYTRTIPMAVITYQNLIEIEAALIEVDRRIVATQANIHLASDNFAREVSSFSRRSIAMNFNPQRFSQEAKDRLRTSCNHRRRVQTDALASSLHDLNILRFLRSNLYNQQNAFRVGLQHIANFAGRPYPAFVVVLNWENQPSIQDDRVEFHRAFHRPRRSEDLGNIPHFEEATVHTLDQFALEITHIAKNSFKIISMVDTETENAPKIWFVQKKSQLTELLRSIWNVYWAFEETLYGWHHSSSWYLQRTIDLVNVFSNMTQSFQNGINESNVKDRYIMLLQVEQEISKKIGRQLEWYYDPVGSCDKLEAMFNKYTEKIKAHKIVSKIIEHHDELKKRSGMINN